MTGRLALGLAVALAGFDLDFVVATPGTVGLRPLHVLAGAAALCALAELRPASSRRPIAIAVLVALATMLVSAELSARGGVDTQAVADTAVVFLIAFAVLLLVRTDDHRTRLLVVLAVSVVAVAAVAALTHFGDADAIFDGRYRGRITRLHGADRLTRPLLHANVAAMFLGPVTVGALVATTFASSPRARALWGAAAGCLALLTTLTASRAAVAAIVVAVALIVVALRRRALAAVGIVVLAVVIAAAISPAVRGRVDDDTRFLAGIEGPGDFTLDQTTEFGIEVENRSSTTWPATGEERVVLTARWRDGAQEHEWLTQVWSLPRTLEPGDTATVPVRIPQPVEDGTYTVIWDLLLDRRAFFLESAGLQEPSIVEVVGSTIEAFEPDDVVRARPNPTRRQIWSWTGELFVERPWFGHGPGALRLVVGEVADTTTVIAPSHAHNLALEPLSAWGLIGAAPTLGLLAALLWSLRWLPRTTDLEGFATGAMLLAMLVHGAVEWALLFPSLGVIFALVAALWVLSVRGEVAR